VGVLWQLVPFGFPDGDASVFLTSYEIAAAPVFACVCYGVSTITVFAICGLAVIAYHVGLNF
jgi:hypothetical protein